MARRIDFRREGRGGGDGEEGHSRLTGQEKEAGDRGGRCCRRRVETTSEKIEAEMKN